jgi:hypothetical protein
MNWRLVQLGFAQISLFTLSFIRAVASTYSEKKEGPNEFTFFTLFFNVVLQRSFAEWKQSIETKDYWPVHGQLYTWATPQLSRL